MTSTDNNEDTAVDVKIAVMNNDIKHINETLGRMEGKFDAAINSFATEQQLADFISAYERREKDNIKIVEGIGKDVKSLRIKDAVQQGFIDSQRLSFNRAITIASLLAVIVGALWWIPTLLHR